LTAARELGNRFTEAGALAQLGRLEAKKGHIVEAVSTLTTALEIAEQVGYRDGEVEIRQDLAAAQL
jgi:hypothetical protein